MTDGGRDRLGAKDGGEQLTGGAKSRRERHKDFLFAANDRGDVKTDIPIC